MTGVSAVEKRAINVSAVDREIGRACVSRMLLLCVLFSVGWRGDIRGKLLTKPQPCSYFLETYQ